VFYSVSLDVSCSVSLDVFYMERWADFSLYCSLYIVYWN